MFIALPAVVKILNELEIRHKTKIVAGGKLINSGKQFMALCMGADALYSARAFMLAMGCIQALQCNKNTCPIGITTHKEELQNGLDVDLKAERIFNYVSGTSKDLYELLAATGEYSFSDLDSDNLFWKDHLI